MNKGKKWHEEHREIIDVIQLINVTGPSIHKESYDWLIKLYDEWKDLKQQLEKEREKIKHLESVIDNCLNELSKWNNIDGYNTQKALEYIQTQLTQKRR